MRTLPLFFILYSLFFTLAGTAQANLTAENVESFHVERIYGVHAMNDGESYARLSPDHRRIVRYSFRTGKEMETIFDVATARDVKLTQIQGYVMSPDESRILVQTETKGIYRHSFTAQYYIYEVASRKMAPLSTGGAQRIPVWSPDGSMIAFVRDNNIFLKKLLFGGAESQVTKDGKFNEIQNATPDWVNEEEFANDRCLVFTADNQRLVWVRYDESEVPLFSFPMYRGLNPEHMDNATYPGSYSYKYPVAGERNSTVRALSFNIKSHKTDTLRVPLDADGYIPRIFATKDASKVAVFTLNRHQDRMDIYMANPATTECQLAVRDEVDKYIKEDAYSQILFTDDGFIMCSERDGYNHIYEYNLEGQLRRKVTDGACVVTTIYGTDPKTGDIYYGARGEDPTQENIFRVNRKGVVTCITPERGTHTAVFSTGCRYFVHVYSNLNTPYVTTLCDNSGKRLETLITNETLVKRLEAENLGTREIFTFTTADDVLLYGIMVKPRNFDPSKRYPVVMTQYSGPGSQRVLDKWAGGEMAEGTMFEHYLCQQGFVCVIVDGRGTGGRGAAFERCTYMNIGKLEARDQAETAAYLGSLPYVDKSRIGIWGWSFGGFCTLLAMSEGRGLFASGVAIAAPTDWRYYDTVYTERFMRTPKENAQGYDYNPMSRAPYLQGDLLLIHGLADDNVHFRNMAEYTEALVQADKDFRELTYTNRNHSIYGGNTRRHLRRQVANHFFTMRDRQ